MRTEGLSELILTLSTLFVFNIRGLASVVPTKLSVVFTLELPVILQLYA